MEDLFEHDGIRFYFRTTGEGPPFVFCHGLGGDIDQVAQLLGPIAARTLVTMDFRRHGRTTPLGDEEKLNFESFAGDLEALLDHLAIDRAVIGGLSLGAGVAAALAVRRPERVEGLVLVRPAWLDRPMPVNLELLPYLSELLGETEPQEALGRFLSTRKAELKEIAVVSRPALESLCQQLTRTGAVQRRARLQRLPVSCPITDWDAVRSLSIPALVVGCDRDPIHPFEFAETWAGNLSGSRLVKAPSKAESRSEHTKSIREHLNSFLESLHTEP